MMEQRRKFEAFKGLHAGPGAFVMPNPWDAGSARLLTHAGFAALATTSAGHAFAKGRRDSFAGLGRDEIFTYAAEAIADAEVAALMSQDRLDRRDMAEND
ncbi:isocitrate lyase/phosphoenolpyruvate mutase family protein [Thalassococcus sp. BH17M4-6]|uniref:isocitrate lyase/phosphoenolpyruvate mutase family protein n=1 Tax=Thalassococcus sp. BH17M4-6 TaxID=3413148 RepID=UPI003BDD997D